MARFRKKRSVRRSGGYMKARRSRSNGSSGLSPMNVLMAGAVYGLARPFASKMLPDLFNFGSVDSDNAIIGGAGYYAMKKGKGFMKALGAVALGSEAGIVASRMSSPATASIGVDTADAYNY